MGWCGVRGTVFPTLTYFSAVRAGMDHNYRPMAGIFSAVIGRTIQIHAPR
jgi:hypothetical protein